MWRSWYFYCVWGMLLSLSMTGQGISPQPALWWKTQQLESGWASLSNDAEIVAEWESGADANVNFHAIPILNDQLAHLNPLPLVLKGGLSTFSVYRDILPAQEQVLWSLTQGSTPIAAASDARFSNMLDQSSYAFAGIGHQWLRLSTHFLNHQSLSNSDCLFYFGRDPTRPEATSSGLLLEELIFDRILSKHQRKQVESYLSVKYGIPLLSSGKLEYVNSAGVVYWSAAVNAAFRHRPTVVGRDDYWQLYQRQATNAYEPDLITIGLDTICSLNQENAAVIENYAFLIWSDNNDKLEEKNSSGLIRRIWQVDPTIMDVPSTSLRLGWRQLKVELEGEEKFWLAIDRSGEHTFDLEHTDYYSPTPNNSAEYQQYEQISWDTDGSGTDHFTFLKGGEIIVALDKELANCTKGEAGSVRFKAYGGTPPYHYRLQLLSVSESSWSGELEVIHDIPVGQYVLEVIDANGQEVKRPFEVQYEELEELVAIEQEYTMIPGQAFQISLAERCDDCAFEWTYPNGERRSGAQLSTTVLGHYQLTIERAGCRSSFDFSLNAEESPFQSVSLWGNPSQDGSFVLEIRLWETKPVSISVITPSGQLIRQIPLPLNHYHKYQGTGLAKGTYFLQVHCDGQVVTKKLITL